MKKYDELYRKDGISLVLSNMEAGAVGQSFERFNENRREVLSSLGLNADKVYFVSQKHSQDIVLTDNWSADPLSESDGIISMRAEEPIAVTVADCMPIFLHDTKNNARAILHSGWKGTGIALKALDLMKKQCGTKVSDVTAVLGPAIGSCCYNVDKARSDIFRRNWGETAVEQREGRYYLSLRSANRTMLEGSGVGDIVSIDRCTACSSDLGSYRREGPDNFTQMFCLSYLNDAT